MIELFRRSVAILFAGVVGFAGTANAQPAPAGDPPARVGRLAFVQGTVSFHDNDQADWAPALVNTPLTSGDALWTEPNARSEVSIAGTRVRMDSGTQLDMLAIDDSHTRMQVDRGRLDIKTFTYDTHQPYEVLTPRGTITLQAQGDYYVEAGSTQDPTRLGVRSGAAQIQAPNGQVLAVRAGEVGEVFDDNGSPQLRTVRSAPPPMPTYWAERDRVVVYDQPPQYVTAGMTGYEDLNSYGSWSNDAEYGQVWAPRTVVAGWEPYRTGRWSYVQPWGWTWVDEQPWGFAPYHYGRWANRNNRWVWVPPQRDLRPVYAPALVAFVGGVELGVAIGQQSRAPVGWFPLGPREVYVPPYSNDRDYYRRLNASARVQDQVMEDRWQRAQRREAIAENQERTAYMNRRFATVVPAEDFARSRPVARVALQVPAERIAVAPVAPVAAPPAPTMSIRAVQAPGTAPATGAAPATRPNEPNTRAPGQPPGQAQGQGTANVQAPAAQVNVPTTETRLSNMQAIGRPQPTTSDRPRAPGPQVATTRPNEPNAAPTATAPNANAPNAAHPGLPPLAPRTGAAPPQLQGERTPAPAQPGQPGTPPKPGDNRAVTTPQQPGAQPPPVQGERTPAPGQPAQPGAPPKPGDNRATTTTQPSTAQPPAAQAPAGQQPRPPGQTNLPPVRDPNANRAEPPKPGEPPHAQPQRAEPQQRPAEPPKPQQAQQPAAPPQPQQQPAPAPQPPRQAEPPKPQGSTQPVAPPQPQRQATPAPQPQAAPAPQPPAQAHAPAPQPQAAPPPQARAPAPPPQTQAAPPPQAHAPAPQPQPQPQAHAPAPPPPQAAHPAPPPQPQHQAAPPPPQPRQQQQAQQPAPQQKKDEEKK